jgi:hypothetical protein
MMCSLFKFKQGRIKVDVTNSQFLCEVVDEFKGYPICYRRSQVNSAITEASKRIHLSENLERISATGMPLSGWKYRASFFDSAAISLRVLLIDQSRQMSGCCFCMRFKILVPCAPASVCVTCNE